MMIPSSSIDLRLSVRTFWLMPSRFLLSSLNLQGRASRFRRISNFHLLPIVATHMMLEAASLDLGSVWISYFDQDKAREMLKLPDNWKPVCMLYIGYPADDFVPNTSLGGHRKPLSETCFYNELSERI